MPTHDYNLANQSGAAFREDLNLALAAIVSNNSNSSSPSTTYAYQWWADTSNNVLKIRNSANNAWIELLQLDGTITLEDGSASSPALGFRDDLDTGVFSGGANEFNISTGGLERFVLDSSGKCGIGEITPAAGLDVKVDTNPVLAIDRGSANNANFNIHYNGTLTGQISAANEDFQISAVGTSTPMSFFANGSQRMRIDSSGRFFVGTITTSLGSSGVFGEICLRGGTEGAGIHMADNDANVHGGFFTSDTSNAMFIRTITNHPMIFRTNNTKRMEVTSSGNVEITNLCVAGAGFTQVDNAQSLISQSGVGSSSTQYFIGNAAIQVSSDRRIKENIVDTSLNAITELNKVRVVDFTWNDPSDKAINNRNSRGKWTGCIAQEIVDIFPHSVNAPRPQGKKIDYESKDLWLMEYEHLVPVLIKAVQELSAKVAALESL
jgi:hypothetical protein